MISQHRGLWKIEFCGEGWLGLHLGKDGGFLPPSGFVANDRGSKTVSPALSLGAGEEGEGWPSKNHVSLGDTNYTNKEESTRPGTILDTGAQRPARQISTEEDQSNDGNRD